MCEKKHFLWLWFVFLELVEHLLVLKIVGVCYFTYLDSCIFIGVGSLDLFLSMDLELLTEDTE